MPPLSVHSAGSLLRAVQKIFDGSADHDTPRVKVIVERTGDGVIIPVNDIPQFFRRYREIIKITVYARSAFFLRYPHAPEVPPYQDGEPA